MRDLDVTYRRLARAWTHDELASHFWSAVQHAAGLPDDELDEAPRPIAQLATAIPPATTASVAIHLLHALPEGARAGLAEDLLARAQKHTADALHRCHRALELDGELHDYTVDEWLATVYDIAIPTLLSARLDQRPPTVVAQAQDAISWLARAVLELDRNSVESASTLAALLACLLIVWLFGHEAREHSDDDDPQT